jgi:hypothetical protein
MGQGTPKMANKPPEAGRKAWIILLLQPTPTSQISYLKNCESLSLCCFKPVSVRPFVWKSTDQQLLPKPELRTPKLREGVF